MVAIIKKKRGKIGSGLPPKDITKEVVFKGLSSILEKAGVSVRREELKRGHGWKATSGFCRHEDTPVIFVDRMLPQDDQIAFLVDQMLDLKVAPSEEDLQHFPEVIQRQLSSS